MIQISYNLDLQSYEHLIGRNFSWIIFNFTMEGNNIWKDSKHPTKPWFPETEDDNQIARWDYANKKS